MGYGSDDEDDAYAMNIEDEDEVVEEEEAVAASPPALAGRGRLEHLGATTGGWAERGTASPYRQPGLSSIAREGVRSPHGGVGSPRGGGMGPPPPRAQAVSGRTADLSRGIHRERQRTGEG